MKKPTLLTAVLIALLIAAGCGASNSSNHRHEAGGNGTDGTHQAPDSLEPIKVEVRIQPEKPAPGEEVTIEALVTQGNEKVNDAEEVMFEIGKEGAKKGEMVPGEAKGDGIYGIRKRFDQAGTYTVIAHVTARDQHNMPKVTLHVGNGEEGSTPEKEEPQQNDSHEQGQEHGLSIQLNGENGILANPDSPLSVRVLKDGKPLSGAAVHFEYWKEGASKHTFLKTDETEEGIYSAKVEPAETGRYRFVIHVEKDSLHEHKEFAIEVK